MAEIIKLYEPPEELNSKKIYRDGIELEKGVVITQSILENLEPLLQKYLQFFCTYPDLFLDLISPQNSNFSLFFYQRIFLRACMRYNTIFITATRAASKTFLSVLAKYLQCVFLPGHIGSVVAPNKNQAVKILRPKINEIWKLFPLLENEVEKANFGKEYTDIYFKNGSRLSIVGALDSDRGIRTHSTLIDEARDHDGDMINEVVIPQMNVLRRTAIGKINPYEIVNGQIIYSTSAGMKSSYSYEALIDIFERSIINPKINFSVGFDYRLPIQHGLINSNKIKELKMSPTYSETAFATEYLGIWQGGSQESWFNFEQLSKYRKIKNPETHAICRTNSEQFYLLSVDIGRLGDATVCCVFRVNIVNGKYYCTLVNLFVLGRTSQTRTFIQQAMDLKKIIRDFQPKEVVIDINGLGIGFADEMIKVHSDEKGNILPSYGFFNDSEYKKIQPKDSINILYGIKANGPLNSKIHGNAYSRLTSGSVRFLIKEQDAKNALLSTKKGQKMSLEDRIRRLLPHEMTTKLFNEMANLRLKRTGVGLDIVLEQINSRFPKDKYSAFAYGLWRIKELEEEYGKKARRRNRIENKRQLTFFTGGK